MEILGEDKPVHFVEKVPRDGLLSGNIRTREKEEEEKRSVGGVVT